MAHLEVNFSQLLQAVERMGAAKREFRIDVDRRPLEPIDIKLREGFEIPLDEITFEGGLPSFEGRQILLYIKDHSYNMRFRRALEDGSIGNRFHVADCRKLQEMRASNRFDRYYVTNDLSGEFEITGIDPDTGEILTGKARLKVCKLCLSKLNYKGYSLSYKQKDEIWRTFRIDEFFQRYSSCFKYLPQHPEDDNAQYADDWGLVAGRLKADRSFRCEQCGVDLSGARNLLHVHHINGVKSDNDPANLKALCVDCHRKQDYHGHLFVSHEQMQTISRLRNEQGIGKGQAWDEALEIADPAVDGVLRQCRQAGFPVPEVGYDVTNDKGVVIGQIELAWPDRRLGVVVSRQDGEVVKRHGWKVWEMIEVLDQFDRFAAEMW